MVISILLGCEESQTVTKVLRNYGFNAFSCDLKMCTGGHPEWHIKGDLFLIAKGGYFITEDSARHFVKKWNAGIFHPPCTYLTATANLWLKDQPERKSGALVGEARREARREAINFFMRIVNLQIEIIAIENPVGSMSSEWMIPTQIIQPFEYGHKEPKKTCLWLKGLPRLRATKFVEPEYITSKSGKRMPKWYAYADKSKGQEHRATIRSKTFIGIAEAMVDQWSPYFKSKKVIKFSYWPERIKSEYCTQISLF